MGRALERFDPQDAPIFHVKLYSRRVRVARAFRRATATALESISLTNACERVRSKNRECSICLLRAAWLPIRVMISATRGIQTDPWQALTWLVLSTRSQQQTGDHQGHHGGACPLFSIDQTEQAIALLDGGLNARLLHR